MAGVLPEILAGFSPPSLWTERRESHFPPHPFFRGIPGAGRTGSSAGVGRRGMIIISLGRRAAVQHGRPGAAGNCYNCKLAFRPTSCYHGFTVGKAHRLNP